MKGRKASGWLFGVPEMTAIVGEGFVGVRIAAIKQGLSFESNFLCPAGTGLVLMLFWPPTRRAARAMKPGLSFERGFLCPAGTEAYFYLLFGPPPAWARRGRLWGCAPFSAPLASPPEAPPCSFPVSAISRGLRGFRFGSFLVVLGDLPARRAMPSVAFALDRDCVCVSLAVRGP